MSSLFLRLSAMILVLAFAGATACSAGTGRIALFQTQLSMRRWCPPAASRLRLSLVAASGGFRPCSNTLRA